MKILSLDPGTTKTGFIYYDPFTRDVGEFGKIRNEDVLKLEKPEVYLACEMFSSYGLNNRTIMEACLWLGRFYQHFIEIGVPEENVYKVYRKIPSEQGIPSTLTYLQNKTGIKMRGKLDGKKLNADAQVRKSLISLYPDVQATMKTEKSRPGGRLKGMAADSWAALSVAVTFGDWAIEQGIIKE